MTNLRRCFHRNRARTQGRDGRSARYLGAYATSIPVWPKRHWPRLRQALRSVRVNPGGHSMKKLLVAAIAAAMALTPTVSFGQAAPAPGLRFSPGPVGAGWGIFGCAGGIIGTAIVANLWQHRQLTGAEAASCGSIYWVTSPPTGNPGSGPFKAFELKDWNVSVDNKTTIGSATGGAGTGKVGAGSEKVINPCKTLFFLRPC
jgi:hypothetical protein